MTNFEWPDDPADALKLPNTNVYIDGSGSMAQKIASVSAFRYAVIWASEERGFQRLYAYNNPAGVKVHQHDGFGGFPHGGDGSYYMLNHAEEQKRRFIVITDDPGQLAHELAKRQHRLGRWALVVVANTVTGGVVDVMSGPNAPGRAYTLPEANPLREAKLAPTSAAKLADSMARASREAVESMEAQKLDPGISPAISEAHNDPELARSYMETLAEAFVALNTDQPHDYDYPRELAEQIVEAKLERQKRERQEIVYALKDLTAVYLNYGAYERAILHRQREGDEFTNTLSRLWRSLKPVHDFVKEALGE